MSQPAAPAVTRDSPKRFDMAAFAARRLKAIAVLGGFLFALLSPLALFKASVYYETSGKILLAREMPQITGRSDEFNIANYFHDYARTQVERIRSAITLEAALESLPEEERKVFQPRGVSMPVAVGRLQKTLSVSQIPNTHVIQIQITGREARGLAAMVNAVMDTYMRRLRHEEENKDTRRLEFLTLERDALARDISEWTARVNDIVQATKTSPDQDQNDIFLHRVMQLQDAYLRAHNEYVQARKEYEQARVEAQELRKVSIQVLADDMVAGDQSLWRTSSWTYEKLQELRASIDGIAKGNPDRQYIEKRMEAMQDYEQKQRKEVRENAQRIVNEKREYEISRRIIAVENAFRVKEQTAADLKSRLDAGLAELETNSLRMLQGKELLRNIENSKKKYFELEGRIRDLQLDSKAPLRVSIESYAIAPESPAGSNLRKLVMMMLMAAMGAVGMAFFVYDFTDPRVRGPKDIQNLMGRPPTWPVSAYPSSPGNPAEFASASLDSPQSREAKAIRSLAVRLNKERTENGARVALFSGVHDGAGSTSLTLNTAHSMRNFCEKVLVIDGNAMRPEVLSLAGMEPMEGGLETALGCAVDVEHCVRKDQARGLDVLVFGRGPWSQEHFRQLPALISRLRERYEFIFIDTAPVLESDLTEALAVLSDICVLAIQGDRTPYPALARSVEIFLRLEVPALATVLNWGGPKPVTRLGALAARLPWPWISGLLAKGSRLSGKSMLLVACAGAALLAAQAGIMSAAGPPGVGAAAPERAERPALPAAMPAAQEASVPAAVGKAPASAEAGPAVSDAPAKAVPRSPLKASGPVQAGSAAATVEEPGSRRPGQDTVPPAAAPEVSMPATESDASLETAGVIPSPLDGNPGAAAPDAPAGVPSPRAPGPDAEPATAEAPPGETKPEKRIALAKKQGRIKSFELSQKAGELIVRVRADQPVERVTWFYAPQAGRLALDVRGAWLSRQNGDIAVSGLPLSRVKVGRHADRVRLLIEWTEMPSGEPAPQVELLPDGARVRIATEAKRAGL